MDNEYIFYHDGPIFGFVLEAISENDSNTEFAYYGRSTVNEVKSAGRNLIYRKVNDFAKRANACAKLCTAHSSGMNPYGIPEQPGEFFADHYDSEHNVRDYTAPAESPAAKNRKAHEKAADENNKPNFVFSSNQGSFDLSEGNNYRQSIYLNQFERLFSIRSIQTRVENAGDGAACVIPGMVVIIRNNFTQCITICANINIRNIAATGQRNFTCSCEISVVTTVREIVKSQSLDLLKRLSSRIEFNKGNFNQVFGEPKEARQGGVKFGQLFHGLNQEVIPDFERLDLKEKGEDKITKETTKNRTTTTTTKTKQ